MDVASPLTARTAGRTSPDIEGSAIFTAFGREFTLATRVADGWQTDDDGAVGRRDSQHPPATGHGHRSP